MKKENKRTKPLKAVARDLNDGVNTPVAGNIKNPAIPANEADLFRQATNPLGDPNKI